MIRPFREQDQRILSFRFCTAPASPLSKVLGVLSVEAVDDPTISNPTAVGLEIYDNEKRPLVAIAPGNVPLALTLIAQLLDIYGVSFVDVANQARERYEII